MMNAYPSERLVDQLVTCTLELDGRLVVVEHVPACVNVETGERFYAPQTVERLQQILAEGDRARGDSNGRDRRA